MWPQHGVKKRNGPTWSWELNCRKENWSSRQAWNFGSKKPREARRKQGWIPLPQVHLELQISHLQSHADEFKWYQGSGLTRLAPLNFDHPSGLYLHWPGWEGKCRHRTLDCCWPIWHERAEENLLHSLDLYNGGEQLPSRSSWLHAKQSPLILKSRSEIFETLY